MEIAIMAPPYYEIPPKKYGAIEREIEYLIIGLDKMKQSTTLVAPKASEIKNYVNLQIVSPYEYGTIESGIDKDSAIKNILEHFENHIQNNKLDILHLYYSNELILDKLLSIPKVPPIVCTISNVAGKKNTQLVKEYANKINFVCVSKAHSNQFKDFGHTKFVHNCVNSDEYRIDRKQKNLIFVGMIEPNKSPITAIEISNKLNAPIALIGGASDFYPNTAYMEKFQKVVNENPHANWKGLCSKKEIADYLATSGTYLYTSGVEDANWQEPFGIVVVEAMLSGCPILAVNNGAIEEIVTDNTGYILQNFTQDEIIKGYNHCNNLDPTQIRNYSMQKFSIESHAMNYMEIYRELTK